MMHLAFWAELANAVSAVVANIIVIVLIWHVSHLLRLVHSARSGQSARTVMRQVDVLTALYGMLGVAVTLLIDQIGVISIRDTVWLWRRMGFGGGGGPMTTGQTEVVVAGTVFLIIGTVGMTYFMSRPTLGIWPTAASLSAVAITAIYYFLTS
jgi:hypothetical protein